MLMPPKSTRSRLTLGSSGLVGVYRGTSVTSCPRASSSTASALSREQLPQYMPAAPAVIERILIRRTLPPEGGSYRPHGERSTSQRRTLERPGTKEEINQVPFVRLQPVQLDGRHRTEIQA